MAKTLFILNEPPHGTERRYNALRLAGSLTRREVLLEKSWPYTRLWR